MLLKPVVNFPLTSAILMYLHVKWEKHESQPTVKSVGSNQRWHCLWDPKDQQLLSESRFLSTC